MSVFKKLNVNQFKNGIVTQVGGAKHFAVLTTIAVYADSNGRSYPSQDTIAKLSGYSRKTVNATIRELKEVKIEGEKILSIRQERTSKGRRNTYQILPKSGFEFNYKDVTKSADDVTQGRHTYVTDEGQPVVTQGLQEGNKGFKETQEEGNKEEEKQELVFDNSRSVLNYFMDKYFETYNVAYKPNFGRDQGLIKKQLMPSFTDQEIILIIDTVFEHYDVEWGNPKFPRPTIGQLSSWLGNKALAMAQDKRKASEQVEADSEKYAFDDEYFEKLSKEF